MFLKLTRIWPPVFTDDPEKREVEVINTDKIRSVSVFGGTRLRIELDGGKVVEAEALLDDFISIVGAKSLLGPWDGQ